MKLELDKLRMKLAHVNVRSELHGEDREPASDLKFEANVPNDSLRLLDPHLKDALYCYEVGRADMADAGKKAEAGFAPHLRFPRLSVGGFHWNDEVSGANLSVSIPGSEESLDLEDVKINKISFSTKEGGTVVLTFRAQCHPDEKIFGKLATLVQTDVLVSVRPAPPPSDGLVK